MCKRVHEYGVILETQPKEAMKWNDSKMKLKMIITIKYFQI